VLVHADPRLVTLAETFGRFSQIKIPVQYTGFVAPRPNSEVAGRMRVSLGVPEGDRLVVISAGAGQVGWPLLQAAVPAARLLAEDFSTTTLVFTGPFLGGDRFDALCAQADPSVRVSRFFSDFLELLAAADLSVSMGGYNTTMNILAARVPALVWPFPQNREQGMRAGRLAELGLLGVLSDDDLVPGKLAARMRKTLDRGRPDVSRIDLGGAEKTANILLSGMRAGQGRKNEDNL
jgi:predicted glycosyltransferase